MQLTIRSDAADLTLEGVTQAAQNTLVFNIAETPPVPPLTTVFGAWVNRPETAGDWWVDAQVLEGEIGRLLGLLRTYHQESNPPTSERERLVFGDLGRRGLINWKPSNLWPAAAGGDVTTNARIVTAARNLRDLGRPVDLAVFHEPADNMSADNTVDAYHAMWANVASIFSGEGAVNARLVYVATGFEGNNDIEQRLFPPEAQATAYDPYIASSLADVVGRFDAKYQWWASANRPWADRPFGWAEWGIGLKSYLPTAERQALAFMDLVDIFDAGGWPLLEFISYFDSGSAKLLPEAIPAFANLANLSRFTPTQETT